MILVGSLEPHGLDWAHLEARLGETPVGEDLRATRVLKDPLSFVATWAMNRPEMRRWVEAGENLGSTTPLDTDDRPYLELVAPRRSVRVPADAASAAAAQHAALSESAGDALTILRGRPGPDVDPSGVAALHRDLAERYLDAEQPGRALAALDAAGAALPDDARAHTRAAELLLEQGHQPEALGRLREAVRRDPDDVKAWDLLGELAIARQDYPLAESAHRAVLRREPTNVMAWLRLGAVLARQDKWREARDALQWATRLDPEAPVDPELERYIAAKAAAPSVVRR
jgi:tetratricopeptide (TPR) repeat protein